MRVFGAVRVLTSLQLPQIAASAGIEFFLTQKLSWNLFNKPTLHTFLWEGLDGTRLFTHFPPADTYNAAADVHDVLKSASNYHGTLNTAFAVAHPRVPQTRIGAGTR